MNGFLINWCQKLFYWVHFMQYFREHNEIKRKSEKKKNYYKTCISNNYVDNDSNLSYLSYQSNYYLERTNLKRDTKHCDVCLCIEKTIENKKWRWNMRVTFVVSTIYNDYFDKTIHSTQWIALIANCNRPLQYTITNDKTSKQNNSNVNQYPMFAKQC